MKLSNPVKAALSGAAWTFIGSVLLLSFGWLSSLASWASSSGKSPLPGLSVIGYAVISAAVSAATGLVTFLVRFAQQQNVIPGEPPAFGQTAAQTAEVAGRPEPRAMTAAATPLTETPSPDPFVAEVQRRRAAVDKANADWAAVRAALDST